MKTISLFIFAIIISLHSTACVDDAPYVPRDTIKPETKIRIPPPPPPPLPPPAPKVEQIFKVVERMPRFPGCEDQGSKEEKDSCAQEKLKKFVQDQLQYPEEAKAKGVEGTVVVSFVVEKDGKVSSAKVVKDIGFGCGKEAVRVIESMNKLGLRWTPGPSRGNIVRVLFNLPVEFKLPIKFEFPNKEN